MGDKAREREREIEGEGEIITGNGSPDLSGCCLSHLQRGLLAVPGGVWGADQIGGILQRALGKAESMTDKQRRKEAERKVEREREREREREKE